MQLPLHSYQSRTTASTSRLVNCFKESLPQGARKGYNLQRAPGIRTISAASFASGSPDGSIGPVTAMKAAFGRLFWISGTVLMMTQRTSSGGFLSTRIGAIGTNSFSTIDIDQNFSDIVVVNNPLAYKCDSTGGSFAQITDVDFTSRGAGDVEFLDQFLLFREPNTGRFFRSDVGSSTAYTSTNFATAESSPDNLVGMKSDHEQILLFGDETTEIWAATGGAGFGFSLTSNGTMELGCANGRTIVKHDETVLWAANDLTVRELRGTTPGKVSHYGIEQILGRVSMSAASGWSYTQEGHLFYVLSFPDACVVYDSTEKEWHERQSYGMNTYRAMTSAKAFGFQIVGDAFHPDGRIGILDSSISSDWGCNASSSTPAYTADPSIMSWTYDPVYADGSRAFHDRLEVIMRTGVGLSTGQGSDPQLMMEVSDDGEAFEFLENRSIGASGKRDTRLHWENLGSADNRVYRGSVSDPVPVTLLDTVLNARGGRL